MIGQLSTHPSFARTEEPGMTTELLKDQRLDTGSHCREGEHGLPEGEVPIRHSR